MIKGEIVGLKILEIGKKVEVRGNKPLKLDNKEKSLKPFQERIFSC